MTIAVTLGDLIALVAGLAVVGASCVLVLVGCLCVMAVRYYREHYQ